MARIGIIHSEKKSAWTSCVSILSGLTQAYLEFFKDDEIFFYDLSLKAKDYHYVETAKKILSDNLDKLIYLNHAPNPRLLLMHLERFKSKDLPKLYFHVYGDFTYQAADWFHSSPYLKEKPVSIVCASHSQQRMVDSFISDGAAYTDYCPFPVNEEVFHYNPGLRQQTRIKYNVKDDEFMLLYTGRLSLQKNIVELCENVIEFSKNSSKKIKLILAGTFDNIGAPMFKIVPTAGYYFHLYNNFISNLSEEDRSRIVYIGNQSQKDLQSLYHAADSFVSLSLYHDEDYGMSPIESLCCGTPAVITDWGGYSSFYDNGEFCKLVNVSIEEDGISIDKNDFFTELEKNIQNPITDTQRQKCSDLFTKKFGIKGASQYLEKIHGKDQKLFPFYNWTLEEVAKVNFCYPTKSSFYEMIYSHYISGIKKSSSSCQS